MFNFESMMPKTGSMNDYGKTMLDSMLKASEIAAESHKKIVAQQSALTEAQFSAFTKMVEAMRGEKPAEVVSAQAEIASKLGEEFMSVAKESFETQIEGVKARALTKLAKSQKQLQKKQPKGLSEAGPSCPPCSFPERLNYLYPCTSSSLNT